MFFSRRYRVWCRDLRSVVLYNKKQVIDYLKRNGADFYIANDDSH